MVSLPYSRSRSRWYGHRVCDVAITVEGPVDRQEEVQKVLSGLEKFSTSGEVYDYDGDDESDATTEQNSFLERELNAGQPNNSVIVIDSDSESITGMTTDAALYKNTLHQDLLPSSSTDDITPILYTKHARPSFTDDTIPILHTKSAHSAMVISTPLKLQPTVKNSLISSDTTPILTPPVLERHRMLLKRKPAATNSSTSSDTTPILTPPVFDRRRKLPSKRENAINKVIYALNLCNN